MAEGVPPIASTSLKVVWSSSQLAASRPCSCHGRICQTWW